jgi:nucleoside-diphosphate-sugar epimerase
MKALVIGASGGFGGAVAREMARRGAEVTALVRPGGRDPGIEGLWQFSGDALDHDAVARAARGMDVIVFGFNVPYNQWDPTVLEAIEVVSKVAAAERTTVLFPGNVYGLGPDFEAPLTEEATREATTRLGVIRNRMEARLHLAAEQGARVIVVRAGDYFGPGAANTWFEHLVSKAVSGGAILDPAPAGVPHAWAFLPDLARTAVDLCERSAALRPYDELHLEGYTLTSAELITALREALGDPGRKVKRFPWWTLKVASPFWSTGRLLLTMRYLWDEPVRLDGSKLLRIMGQVQVTPLVDAIRATIAAMSTSADQPAAAREAA